jgi:hypothetical protein
MAMAGPAVNISKAKSVRHIGISNQEGVMTIRFMGHYGFERLILNWAPRGLSGAMSTGAWVGAARRVSQQGALDFAGAR